MKKVKLQDTGEYGFDTDSYKAPNKKYYSSEDAYRKIVRNVEYRAKCIDKIYEILEYGTYMKIPTYFYKRLKECEGYGYDVVYRCMCNKSKDIKWAVNNKEFNTEVGKFMYIWAILNNSMNDALKEIISERNDKEKMKKNMENVIGGDELDIKEVKQRTINISKFLEN